MSSPRVLHVVALSLAILCPLLPAAAFAADSAFPDIGIDQKLGSPVPLDTRFVGESGEPLSLRQLVTAPTILALVYYNCPNVCDFLLTGLAGVLGPLPAEPGVDYNVVTISIDPDETPKEARKAKRIGLETIQKPFPPGAWRFLTGDEQSIHAVAESIGFHYKRNGDGFDHPVAIVILSPNGKIVRYMYGADFLPADLKLSLMEAQAGKIGPTIAKLVRICFRVDPKSHSIVFMTTRVVASVTLLVAGALAAYLVIAGRRRRGGSAARKSAHVGRYLGR
jgi:protein SCO1